MTALKRMAMLFLWLVFFSAAQQEGAFAFRAPTTTSPIIRYSLRRHAKATALRALPPWLPSCAITDVTRVAAASGCVGLVSQLALTKLIQKTKLRPIARYTAHTIVAMVLMLLVSSMGVVGWWYTAIPATPYARLLEPVASARWLAAVVAGMFAIWDIPVSIAVPQLRKIDVIVHHIVMTIVAWVGAVTLPMHYLFFYLGISELSSIPLLCYDQLQVTVMSMKESRLTTLRDRFQIMAAICFTLIRAYYFTKITLMHFVPDVRFVLPTANRAVNALRFGMIASIGFTALQLYWFSKIVRVVVLGESMDGHDGEEEDVLSDVAT